MLSYTPLIKRSNIFPRVFPYSLILMHTILSLRVQSFINVLLLWLQFVIAPTDLRLNDDYTKHYNQNLRIIFTGLIPLLALVYFNYKIYTAFKQRLRNMRGK